MKMMKMMMMKMKKMKKMKKKRKERMRREKKMKTMRWRRQGSHPRQEGEVEEAEKRSRLEGNNDHHPSKMKKQVSWPGLFPL